MINAKEELLNRLKDINKGLIDIEFMGFRYDKSYDESYIYHNIDELDFNYDNGFGSQELFGYVVFKDKSWLERYEYDGAEGWDFKETPTYEELKDLLE